MDAQPLALAKILGTVFEIDKRVEALEEANANKRIGWLESARNVPHMFFAKLDERLAIVEGAIAGRPLPERSTGNAPEPEVPDNGSSNWQVPEVESPGVTTDG